MNRFDYLINRLSKAKFESDPFKHIYLENFFADKDFQEIVSSPEIASPEVSNDLELLESLEKMGYKTINFPGAITDKKKYIQWHQNKTPIQSDYLEGYGLVMRLYDPTTPIIVELNDFLDSPAWNTAIANKFGIDKKSIVNDNGIQKYLDGYEISPHPDIRSKAATFMVNINPSPISEGANHHTHYMKFTQERQYVKSFWEHNRDIQRCWVPWSWGETKMQQVKNNSAVFFAPNDDTLHAVKADYNHLLTQRTQLYGNLWYKNGGSYTPQNWKNIDLRTHSSIKEEVSIISRLNRKLKDIAKTKKDIGKRRFE